MIDREQIRNWIENYLKDSDYELITLEISAENDILVEVDSLTGVDVDFCAELNRFLVEKLEGIQNTEYRVQSELDYSLEVGSVSLTDPFKTKMQFAKNLGHNVEALVCTNGQNTKYKGLLVSVDEETNVSGAGTALSDLIFAMIAAFAVMPAVFAAGLQPGSGPGLVFETLPYIFNKMGEGMPIITTLVSTVFFVAILAAALTSAISMLEVGVAFLTDERGMKRRNATLLLAFLCWAVGILCSLSFGSLSGVKILGLTFFDFLDTLCSDWLLPLGGLIFTLFVGWKMSKADVRDEFTNGGTKNVRLFGAVYFLMRFLAPVGIVAIFLTNLFL